MRPKEWVGMLTQLASDLVDCIRCAASKLTGFARRQFQAEMAIKFCEASPRKTESCFGFNRRAVQRGLLEREKGKPQRNTPERRGRPKVE